jgi:hypothetical protein
MSVATRAALTAFLCFRGKISDADIFWNFDCTLADFVIRILLENMEKTLFIFLIQ